MLATPVFLTTNDLKPTIYYKDEELQPLFGDEVIRRQKMFGKNQIEKHSSRRWHTILLNSIFDPFNVLLIGISFLSLTLNDWNTFVIMVIMVFISSGIRFFQEQQSETKLNDLTSMVKKNITVIRRNALFEYEEIVDLSECVPGDFVKLSAGDRIPADIQLIKANSLFIDQSILTGESMPCLKYVKDSKEITIPYDLNQSDHYYFKKKKNRFAKFKDIAIKWLRENYGIDTNEEKIKFDNDILVQFDKNDLCFMGTSVISGCGCGVVLATGKHTFFGVMSEHVSFHKPLTSFNKGIKQISLVFIFLMVVIILPIILCRGFGLLGEKEVKMSTGERWIYAAQFALSVAVGLTPEMLPIILNANLAKGTINLSNKNCIVKRLESITNLGSMNILCTDKTGTLTENFIELCHVFDYRKKDCLIGLELAYLNSAYQDAFKNLTDQAIISAYGEKVKQIRNLEMIDFSIRKIKEIPFDFSRRKVTIVLEIPEFNIRVLITKGAVNEILDVCTHYLDQSLMNKEDNKVLSLNNLFNILKKTLIKSKKNENELDIRLGLMASELVKQLHKFNDNLNQNGYRVLAVAYQIEQLKKETSDHSNAKESEMNLQEKDLIFVSFLTFLNPPKKSAAKAIRDLMSNNIRVKVLTGDTQEVCKNVCNLIGLATNSIISSKTLNKLNEKELEEASISTVIFSQLTPIQKFEIVRVLKKQGHVVGFLGDGINDVLALKEADVGISVDSGTEIAKDAADIILLQKELDVINEGVKCGRESFLNTIKYISMALSGNFGNVISIFASCIWLPYLPMAPIQILLQNLLYDISQMTSPWDNVDLETLRKPEVFKLRNLLVFMIFWGVISSFFDLLTFSFLYFYYEIKRADDNVALFQTGWFTVGVLTQTLVFHIIRTHKLPVIRSNASFKVYISTIATLIFGIILPAIPLGRAYSMVLLPSSFYYFLLFVLFTYCLSVQILKSLYIYLFRSWFTRLE